MQLGELLNKLATSAGIPADNEHLKLILSSPALSTSDIPNDFAGSILSGLLTTESARNNEAIRNHYFALFNNGGDAHLNRLLDEYGLDEQIATEIKSQPKTFQKWEKLTSKIKELTEAKATAKGGDKKVLEDEISKLNGQLKTVTDEYEVKIGQTNQSWFDRLKSIEIEKELSSREYPKDRDKQVYVDLAKLYLERKLSDQKVKVNYDPDKNNISLLSESGMQYFENNSPVNFKNFVDSILAENKLIPTSAPPAQTRPNVITSGNNSKTSAYDAKIDEMISLIK